MRKNKKVTLHTLIDAIKALRDDHNITDCTIGYVVVVPSRLQSIVECAPSYQIIDTPLETLTYVCGLEVCFDDDALSVHIVQNEKLKDT